MIDRYTTGVDNVLVEYTSQISFLKICSVYFSVKAIKINISSKVSDNTREPVAEQVRVRRRCMKRAERSADLLSADLEA
jgi:hypothetical protein